MGVDLMAPLDPTSGLTGFGERGACPRERTARQLQITRLCLSSIRVSSSGGRYLEEPGMRPEGSDLEDGDEGVELDFDDEPEALLVFLSAHRKGVAKSLFWVLLGLPRCVKLVVLDSLTF